MSQERQILELLVHFLNNLQPIPRDLIAQLTNSPGITSIWMLRTKEVWLRRLPEHGDDIFNIFQHLQNVDISELHKKVVKPDIRIETGSLSPHDVLKSLSERISCDDNRVKTLFSVHDSMETLNLDNSVLNLTISSLDGTPNLLYTKEVYDAEKEIGIEMPVDKVEKFKGKTIVLIGVSGCGKTRTCYDLCRRHWGLYFDCTVDEDFIEMIHEKSNKVQKTFENESERYIRCLITSRLVVLQTLLNRNPDLDPYEWLCIQRSRRTRLLFTSIFTELYQLPHDILDCIYTQLKNWFPDDGKVVFDEAQRMLDLLKYDYRSTDPNQQDITPEGTFAFPRSFFSFLSRTIIESGFNSIWCGAQMRIRNMELIYSSAEGKPNEINIFTDFTYLKPQHIFKLLSKWLKVDLTGNLALYEEIANLLQGRPRVLASFLHRLIESNDIDASFRSYWRDMTNNWDSSLTNSSFYSFWQQRIDWSIEPLSVERTNSPAFQKRLVTDILIKICISYLFGDGSSIVYSPDLDLVSTSLVMISKVSNDWTARMAEPIVLNAGLNFLADQDSDHLMNYFAYRLFSPLVAPNLTPQERGHMMEFVIALRFIQGWWLEPAFKKHLPWPELSNIRKPLGIIDCRTHGDSGVNMFVQQLRNPDFPWVLFPPTNAGPDLRYSFFCCYIKTTSTANSKTIKSISFINKLIILGIPSHPFCT